MLVGGDISISHPLPLPLCLLVVIYPSPTLSPSLCEPGLSPFSIFPTSDSVLPIRCFISMKSPVNLAPPFTSANHSTHLVPSPQGLPSPRCPSLFTPSCVNLSTFSSLVRTFNLDNYKTDIVLLMLLCYLNILSFFNRVYIQ